jgi:hypothetical protein
MKKIADIGDVVEIKINKGNSIATKTFGGFQGVVFGISPEGLAQVQWVTKDCGLTVHWHRENLKVVKPNPLKEGRIVR